jgi:ribosomal 50S subunit-recycling heat shock protein
MRLDKYLVVARMVKQRSVANELCDSGHVTVNGRTAKAAREIAVGETIVLTSKGRRVTVEVLEIPATKSVSKERALELTRIIKEENLSDK